MRSLAEMVLTHSEFCVLFRNIVPSGNHSVAKWWGTRHGHTWVFYKGGGGGAQRLNSPLPPSKLTLDNNYAFCLLTTTEPLKICNLCRYCVRGGEPAGICSQEHDNLPNMFDVRFTSVQPYLHRVSGFLFRSSVCYCYIAT